MKCPRCDAEVEGKFCGVCGAALEPRSCPACASAVPPGFRFCSECGAQQAADVAGASNPSLAPGGAEPAIPPSSDRRRWWIAGGAVAGALVFLSLPYVWTGWADPDNSPRMTVSSAAAPAPGTGAAVDLSTMTRREAADRLFNRVMSAQSSGDATEVANFLPMAIDAYRLVEDLDADGHFHLALLQQTAGDHAASLQTAERVLASSPDHLLALYAAGEAARGMGDAERALRHFRHLLDVFEMERARDLPEYREHASFLPTARETAEEFTGSSGS